MEEFDRLNTDVIAICVDSVEENAKVAEKLKLSFPVLSDPEMSVIDDFGLRHVDGGFGRDIARPAVFIVDEAGQIIWRHLTDNWRIRVRPAELLSVLREHQVD